MRTEGWIIMIASLALVWSVTIWAYTRLLSAPREDRGED